MISYNYLHECHLLRKKSSKFTSASMVGLGLTEAILRIQAYIRACAQQLYILYIVKWE